MEAFLSPLTKAEEEDCIKRLNNNDKSAREQLILHNMRLVAHVTKKYSVNEDESEELISIGTVGLIKAVSSFKADYGSRFATYAIRCIENEILMFLRKSNKLKGEISIDEPLNKDGDGNELLLSDILGTEPDITSRNLEDEVDKILLRNSIAKLKNREKAMKHLVSKLFEMECEKQRSQVESERRLQVGTGDRSEKIRTYNFPQGRITDHRIKYTVYQLEAFLDGDLEEMIDALTTFDQAEKLKSIAE